ncbi:hypothetical protein [Belliella pelovolcani]
MLFQKGDSRREMQDTRNCCIGNFGINQIFASRWNTDDADWADDSG